MLVSKYIGETEQNLNALFDAANNEPMVLLFDEAESLFGKRGDIKDARDRYANMEVSHLLSRIEYHYGPCILTSNLQEHLDSAFARRFQCVVEFPRPNSQARTVLWRKHLPPKAPLSDDVDLNMLGEAISMTGGQIRNAALHAAFLSAANQEPIGLYSLSRAIWNELSKEGRGVMPSNLGFLSNYLTRENEYVKDRTA
jgi:SpoVK/Ycf46/Vps4 family AAA+-type ATPase